MLHESRIPTSRINNEAEFNQSKTPVSSLHQLHKDPSRMSRQGFTKPGGEPILDQCGTQLPSLDPRRRAQIHRFTAATKSGVLSHVTSGAGILTEALEGVKEQVKQKSSNATDMKQGGNSVAKFFRRPDSKQCTNENLAIVGL